MNKIGGNSSPAKRINLNKQTDLAVALEEKNYWSVEIHWYKHCP